MPIVTYAEIKVGTQVSHCEDQDPYHFDGKIIEIDSPFSSNPSYFVEWQDEVAEVKTGWYRRSQIVAQGDSDVVALGQGQE